VGELHDDYGDQSNKMKNPPFWPIQIEEYRKSKDHKGDPQEVNKDYEICCYLVRHIWPVNTSTDEKLYQPPDGILHFLFDVNVLDVFQIFINSLSRQYLSVLPTDKNSLLCD